MKIQTAERRYEIWVEGWKATGGGGRARFFGAAWGETFRDACVRHMAHREDADRFFDESSLAWWACRLYPTEAEARESFG